MKKPLEHIMKKIIEKYIQKRKKEGVKYVLLEWRPFVQESFFKTNFFAKRNVDKSRATNSFDVYDYNIFKIPKNLEERLDVSK